MKKLFTLVAMAFAGSLVPALADAWEVTYPAGAQAASVDLVQIKNSEVGYKYLAEDATATLLDGAGQEIKTLVRDDIILNLKGKYSTVDFEFNPAITEPGDYTISVPENIFTTNDQTQWNAAFTVSFTVVASSAEEKDWGWTCVSPADGKGTALEYVILHGNNTVGSVNATATAQLYDANFAVVAQLDATNNLFPYEGNLMVALDPAITTVGNYMLVLNANAVLNADGTITNTDAYIQLAVESPAAPEYAVTALPEDNSTVSTVDGIQAVYISVQGYAFSAGNDSGKEMTITKDGNSFASVGSSALSVAMDRSSVVLILPEAAQLLEAGNYVLTMPAGYFTMKSQETSEIVESPEIVLHYTLEAPAGEPLSWTVEPAAGAITELSKVTLTFNKPVKIAQSSFVGLFYTNSSYLPETVTDGVISVSNDGLVATIEFTPVFKDGGIFQVRLYEGNEQLAVVDGEVFPGINITYKVDAPLYVEATPADGSTVESLQETKIKLPRNTKIEKSENFAAWYVCGETKVAAELEKLAQYDFGDPSYIVVKSADAVTAAGDWELVVEAGSLIISNYGESMTSPELRLSYTIEGGTSGVDAIIGSGCTADVYNMQGMCIKKNAGADEVNSLPRGLYIIGKQKVYKK